MKHITLVTSTAALILTVAPAHADSTGFQGFYAPETWTVTGVDIGGSSAIFAADGSELVITGADGGVGADTDASHVIATDGVLTCEWSFLTLDIPFFDSAYYLINGDIEFLSDGFGSPNTGTLSVAVQAGDIFTFRVFSLDGVFGAGFLTITDFRAPVPAPAALALVGLAGLISRRRRA